VPLLLVHADIEIDREIPIRTPIRTLLGTLRGSIAMIDFILCLPDYFRLLIASVTFGNMTVLRLGAVV
jgi:hypothetical protein